MHVHMNVCDVKCSKREHLCTDGRPKMLIAADSDEILGFTAFGAEAGELMIAVQVAMMARMPYTALRGGIFTHPTAGEGLVFLLSGTPRLPEGMAIALSP